MTEIRFIRHGESESNAGLPSSSDLSTPLTQKGMDQAQWVAQNLNFKPNLFILSPYLRAQQTAVPALLKYPNVPVEIWPIQEFSYLSYDMYQNTTSENRRSLSINYFKEADPDKVLGEGGESFHQFIQRIGNAITSLQETDADKIIIFGHGWFVRAFLWQMYNLRNTRIGKREFINLINSTLPSSRFTLKLFHWLEPKKWFKKMFSFLIFSAGIQTPNCAIFKFTLDQYKNLELVGYDISHLPKGLQQTTFTNR